MGSVLCSRQSFSCDGSLLEFYFSIPRFISICKKKICPQKQAPSFNPQDIQVAEEFCGYEVCFDLLGAIKPRVTQALSSDNMADAVETVTAVVLTVLAIRAIGAAHLAPIAHKRNAMITVISELGSMSHRYYHSTENCMTVAAIMLLTLKMIKLYRKRRSD